MEGRAFQDQHSARSMCITSRVGVEPAGDHVFG